MGDPTKPREPGASDENETERNGGNGRDPVSGKFLPGNPGGPGRPKGSKQLAAMVRREVAKGELDVDQAVRELLMAMKIKGTEGDSMAAKVALSYLAPQQQRGPTTAVQVNVVGPQGLPVREVGPPPVPPPAEFRRQILALLGDDPDADLDQPV